MAGLTPEQKQALKERLRKGEKPAGKTAVVQEARTETGNVLDPKRKVKSIDHFKEACKDRAIGKARDNFGVLIILLRNSMKNTEGKSILNLWGGNSKTVMDELMRIVTMFQPRMTQANVTSFLKQENLNQILVHRVFGHGETAEAQALDASIDRFKKVMNLPVHQKLRTFPHTTALIEVQMMLADDPAMPLEEAAERVGLPLTKIEPELLNFSAPPEPVPVQTNAPTTQPTTPAIRRRVATPKTPAAPTTTRPTWAERLSAADPARASHARPPEAPQDPDTALADLAEWTLPRSSRRPASGFAPIPPVPPAPAIPALATPGRVPAPLHPEEEPKDRLYARAVEVVAVGRMASVSWIQRRLGIGLERATKLIQKMEREGLVGPENEGKLREVLVPPDYRVDAGPAPTAPVPATLLGGMVPKEAALQDLENALAKPNTPPEVLDRKIEECRRLGVDSILLLSAILKRFQDHPEINPSHRLNLAIKATELMPNDLRAWFLLAGQNEDMGHLEDALRSYESVLALDPDNPIAIENIRRIQGLLEWRLPTLDLLDQPGPPSPMDTAYLRNMAARLTATLTEYGVQVECRETQPGPVVSQFVFELPAGSTVREDIGIDLATSMSFQNPFRVVNTGNHLNIEVPNRKPEKVALAEVIASHHFQNQRAHLPLALGKTAAGAPLALNLTDAPHLLVAANNPNEKENVLHALIMSLLYSATPDDTCIVWVEGGEESYKIYQAVDDKLILLKKNLFKLENAIKERIQILARDPAKKMPRIVIVINELADWMQRDRAGTERMFELLRNHGKRIGIHLMAATSHPDTATLTESVKDSLPVRIACQASADESAIVLDDYGAETLLGNGDTLVLHNNTLMRVQAPSVTMREIERVVDALKNQEASPLMDEEPTPPHGTDTVIDFGRHMQVAGQAGMVAGTLPPPPLPPRRPSPPPALPLPPVPPARLSPQEEIERALPSFINVLIDPAQDVSRIDWNWLRDRGMSDEEIVTRVLIEALEDNWDRLDFNRRGSLCREALKLAPQSVAVYLWIGAHYEAANQLQEALVCYNQAFPLHPTDTDLHTAKTRVLYRMAKKIVAQAEKVDKQQLKRELDLTFQEVNALIKRMEEDGVISKAGFLGGRKIFLSKP